jgi:hypothetical protein
LSASDSLGVVTPTEIAELRKSARGGLRHPVAALADGNGVGPTAKNTEESARRLLQKNRNWLPGLRPRLLDTSDFTDSSSALGEIRAYDALLETALAINPGSSVTGKNVVPEFEVDAGDGAVIVEVHSRQLDGAQVQAIAQLR